ncbi:45567_t:CDS:2 [Gigaspora margarita]|uniref:45567_t:CDS:1 n=1 Tax=Gigaspora margarita TaxID=4874 RepID=A0ABM8VZ75_GIGMA|nr:45567_t:CDS:2 [Gigaspora margarita]
MSIKNSTIYKSKSIVSDKDQLSNEDFYTTKSRLSSEYLKNQNYQPALYHILNKNLSNENHFDKIDDKYKSTNNDQAESIKFVTSKNIPEDDINNNKFFEIKQGIILLRNKTKCDDSLSILEHDEKENLVEPFNYYLKKDQNKLTLRNKHFQYYCLQKNLTTDTGLHSFCNYPEINDSFDLKDNEKLQITHRLNENNNPINNVKSESVKKIFYDKKYVEDDRKYFEEKFWFLRFISHIKNYDKKYFEEYFEELKEYHERLTYRTTINDEDKSLTKKINEENLDEQINILRKSCSDEYNSLSCKLNVIRGDIHALQTNIEQFESFYLIMTFRKNYIINGGIRYID